MARSPVLPAALVAVALCAGARAERGRVRATRMVELAERFQASEARASQPSTVPERRESGESTADRSIPSFDDNSDRPAPEPSAPLAVELALVVLVVLVLNALPGDRDIAEPLLRRRADILGIADACVQRAKASDNGGDGGDGGDDGDGRDLPAELDALLDTALIDLEWDYTLEWCTDVIALGRCRSAMIAGAPPGDALALTRSLRSPAARRAMETVRPALCSLAEDDAHLAVTRAALALEAAGGVANADDDESEEGGFVMVARSGIPTAHEHTNDSTNTAGTNDAGNGGDGGGGGDVAAVRRILREATAGHAISDAELGTLVTEIVAVQRGQTLQERADAETRVVELDAEWRRLQVDLADSHRRRESHAAARRKLLDTELARARQEVAERLREDVARRREELVSDLRDRCDADAARRHATLTGWLCVFVGAWGMRALLRVCCAVLGPGADGGDGGVGGGREWLRSMGRLGALAGLMVVFAATQAPLRMAGLPGVGVAAGAGAGAVALWAVSPAAITTALLPPAGWLACVAALVGWYRGVVAVAADAGKQRALDAINGCDRNRSDDGGEWRWKAAELSVTRALAWPAVRGLDVRGAVSDAVVPWGLLCVAVRSLQQAP